MKRSSTSNSNQNPTLNFNSDSSLDVIVKLSSNFKLNSNFNFQDDSSRHLVNNVIMRKGEQGDDARR